MRWSVTLGIGVLGLLVGGSASAQNVHVKSWDEPVERCDQLDITYDDEPAARSETQLTASLADAPTLTANPLENGGVYVVGSDRADYAITVCKAARRAEPLARIDVRIERGVISTQGPSGERWLVYLLVKAPRRAAVVLETWNGPLMVAGLSGRVQARTTNGPIALRESSGSIDATAQNGPISFSGQAGEVRLTAANGPIDVRLTGDRWQHGSLTARGQNGPVSVRVAEDYQSGVRVESANHSPWSCKGPSCGGGRKNWDDDSRSIELGSGPIAVRVSTVNGPVQIATGTHASRKD